MLYQPRYCCQCGEAIERTEWRLWTSRRFCELCETEHVAGEWIPRIYLIVSLIFVIFGFGHYASRAGSGTNETSAPRVAGLPEGRRGPAIGREHGDAAVSDGEPADEASRAGEGTAKEITGNAAPGNAVPSAKPRPAAAAEQNQRVETVYICGAETKKGTACSRRVRNGGRCWQHQGKPAILPEKDLVVTR